MNEPQGAGIIAKNETGPSETFIYITAVMEVFFGRGVGLVLLTAKMNCYLHGHFTRKKKKRKLDSMIPLVEIDQYKYKVLHIHCLAVKVLQ